MPSASSRLRSQKRYQLILSAVHMVYRLVNSTFNQNELCLRLTRLLCQFIQASSAEILLLDSERKKVAMAALYNNKINILLEKKSELKKITAKEKKVTQGFSIFEKRLISLPLVADECVGAIFIRRKKSEPAFNDFDKDMLSVFAEQAVTAIRNLQLYEEQQKVILGSMKFIDKLLSKKSHWIMSHSPGYFTIVKALAEKLHVSQRGIEMLLYASILHDAGAVDIPYEILSKSGHLTSGEFKIIRDLPAKSVELIRPVEFLKPVLPIILYHHERYDGTGYPSGLKKEQIPLGARIMAVVDAFEAMLRGRPYREKVTIDQAIEELKRNSGTQFDPKVIQSLVELCQSKKFRNSLRKIGQSSYNT